MINLKIHKNKVLIAGANGLLGQKLVNTFADDFEIYGVGRKTSPSLAHLDYTSCDITHRRDIRKLVQSFNPNFVLNAAAYTNVDGCEDDKENCWKVNVKGVENLAQAARSVGATFIHVSTDYVFDGTEEEYTEASTPKPISYYGRAKLAGENAVIISEAAHAIVRTMILYGTGANIGPNFATWLVNKLSKGEPVPIVDDQFGHPTLADDLAKAIRKIVELNKTDLFHICGSDYLSRHDFAVKLADIFDFDASLITRIKTADLNQKANRPLKTKFSLEKARKELGIEMSGVEEGLTILKKQLSGLDH
ncbi:dTDP-4-dehydrorhamnose reductase [candidate division KSB1 bacterium]|nr:dTDP-4-dehydrorhamnose reductase [candidate division KSB1 bacterium]NIR72813.1 dTDP-4-dehydrorhamnose reductase [candidate division KSB1 bacterium]NIS26853.1 dTDP-4-dehydrorhamnose reductase [candidate division KSB1 bacterium]NIT73649.1 dTDP-4-dehydrorhamnose reductase [candidate division KSB1 bacterium]NIU27520.1 dTDP-4-dehydrorhamnose reductase [candidate division KSB1 bacterium]